MAGSLGGWWSFDTKRADRPVGRPIWGDSRSCLGTFTVRSHGGNGCPLLTTAPRRRVSPQVWTPRQGLEWCRLRCRACPDVLSPSVLPRHSPHSPSERASPPARTRRASRPPRPTRAPPSPCSRRTRRRSPPRSRRMRSTWRLPALQLRPVVQTSASLKSSLRLSSFRGKKKLFSSIAMVPFALKERRPCGRPNSSSGLMQASTRRSSSTAVSTSPS